MEKKPKGMRNFWFTCPYCDEKVTVKIRKSAIKETDDNQKTLNTKCPDCKSAVKFQKPKYGKQWKAVDVTFTPRGLRPRIEEIDETVAQLHKRRRD